MRDPRGARVKIWLRGVAVTNHRHHPPPSPPPTTITHHRRRLEHRTFQTPSKKAIEITTIASNYHIEINGSDAGIYDRFVVQVRRPGSPGHAAAAGYHHRRNAPRPTPHAPRPTAPTSDPSPRLSPPPHERRQQELIKEIASSNPLQQTEGAKGFKVVVLMEVDRLTKQAQAALRRTMEKYTGSCRLILYCTNPTKVIEPVRSRCLGIRIPVSCVCLLLGGAPRHPTAALSSATAASPLDHHHYTHARAHACTHSHTRAHLRPRHANNATLAQAPSHEEICECLQTVARKEGLNLPPVLASRVSQAANRNLRRALLMLEATKVQAYPFNDDQPIQLPDWELYIAQVSRSRSRSHRHRCRRIWKLPARMRTHLRPTFAPPCCQDYPPTLTRTAPIRRGANLLPNPRSTPDPSSPRRFARSRARRSSFARERCSTSSSPTASPRLSSCGHSPASS